jgi:hypothetical protein
MPLAIYRRGAERPRVRATGTTVLPPGAGEAQRTLLELLESDQIATASSATAGDLRALREARAGRGGR